MNDNYVHRARGVSDLKAHLVLCTKYRRKALDNEMLTRLKTILKELMKKWEGKLIEFNGESDHIHAIIQYSPQTQPSKLINNIKTVSSRYLRKEFSAKLDKNTVNLFFGLVLILLLVVVE